MRRAAALLLACAAPTHPQTAPKYDVRLLPDGDVEIARGRQRERFAPHFTVIARADDPRLRYTYDGDASRDPEGKATVEAYILASWNRPGGTARTEDLFQSGGVTRVRATGAEREGGAIRWSFAPRPDFRLEATLSPDPAGGAPTIAYAFTPARAGWYSVGYTGAPATDPARATAFWQPQVWQERRFPRAPLISPEHLATLPVSLVERPGGVVGVATDPSESPFRMPADGNARFGVLLRDADGLARPMAFAPLMGRGASGMAAGSTFAFKARPVLAPDWYAGVEHVARDLFAFRDVRENGGTSLNRTLDNLVDFAMDERLSGWEADLKGFNYDTDVQGSVKVVSALHPLSMALVRDDPEIYRRRALPMTEFLLSREKFLFSTIGGSQGQAASSRMDGPTAELGEIATLHAMAGGRSPALADAARGLVGRRRALNLSMVSTGDQFPDRLALYRMTGDRSHLLAARRLADAYIARRIDTPQRDFSDVRIPTGGQFWSDFTPKWIDLFELWEETRDGRHLDAARRGARHYASLAWLYPTIPDGPVTVDAGGQAPDNRGSHVRGEAPMRSPERSLPAWRVSQIGLVSEASLTAEVNPAVLLAHHGPYLLRLGAITGDRFMADIGRSAVVGRYANYPGYDINEMFTGAILRADYPLRPYREFAYNQIYYNHVWPQIAIVSDYLFTQAETRSGGRVRFPSRYAQGYAYLQSRVYGDRPGTFYGQAGVRAFMPKGLVEIGDPEINHVSGYSAAGFHLALMNEARVERVADVRLDPDRLPFTPGRRYAVRVWRDGVPGAALSAVDGRVSVPVPPRGLTALTFERMPVFTRLHDAAFDRKAKPLGARSHSVDRPAFGKVTGMLLSMGRGLTNAFVWMAAGPDAVREARLTYTDASGARRTVVDRAYPFEFSLRVPDAQAAFAYRVEAVRTDGSIQAGAPTRLER